MPSGDGTGPEGKGPKTGRGLGRCGGYDAPGYTRGIPRGMGRGRGAGNGPGRGNGLGRRNGFGRGFGWTDQPSNQSDIKQEINDIKSEIESIKRLLNNKTE